MAIKLRNHAAHGANETGEFPDFILATAAVETIAFLATFQGLGLEAGLFYQPRGFAGFVIPFARFGVGGRDGQGARLFRC